MVIFISFQTWGPLTFYRPQTGLIKDADEGTIVQKEEAVDVEEEVAVTEGEAVVMEDEAVVIEDEVEVLDPLEVLDEETECDEVEEDSEAESEEDEPHVYECGHENSLNGSDWFTQLESNAVFRRELCDSCVDDDLIREQEAVSLIEQHLEGNTSRKSRFLFLADRVRVERYSLSLEEYASVWFSQKDLHNLFQADDNADNTL